MASTVLNVWQKDDDRTGLRL